MRIVNMQLLTQREAVRRELPPSGLWKLVLSFGVLLSCAAAVGAQAPVSLGDIIRVWTSDSGKHSPYTGTVVGVAGDTIVFVPRKQSDSLTLLQRDITRLLVREEKGMGAAMGIGALIGTLAGSGIAAIAISRSDSDWDWSLYGGLTGAGAGLLGGSIIGLVLGADRWRVVPLRPFAQSAFLDNRRIRVGVTLRL
ncbi:MAG: hypothetical protein H7Z74_03920 [Anaerolineae bacterium]|nr:hypothetical protein [Gemmatimonadaceae bacterium]